MLTQEEQRGLLAALFHTLGIDPDPKHTPLVLVDAFDRLTLVEAADIVFLLVGRFPAMPPELYADYCASKGLDAHARALEGSRTP